jgi:hypothetical protein
MLMMADTDPTHMHGPTKIFADDPNVDRLFAMVLALAAEISKVDEKLDTVLRLLDRHEIVTMAEACNFEPDAEQQAARDAVRKMFIETLLAPFQAAADAIDGKQGLLS